MTGLEAAREHAATITDDDKRSAAYERIWKRESAARTALVDQDVSGERFLLDFADDVLTDVAEAIEYADGDLDSVDDRLNEIADSAVPVSTYARIMCVAEDVGLSSTEPEGAEGLRTVCDLAGALLYDLACQIASAKLAEAREEQAA